MNDSVTIDLTTALEKSYNIRPTSGYVMEITVPKDALEREARVQGLSLAEYIQSFEVVWHYGSFPGMYLTFRKKDHEKG